MNDSSELSFDRLQIRNAIALLHKHILLVRAMLKHVESEALQAAVVLKMLMITLL
ncbi:MAG: hypothetical protein ACXW04_06005 [Methylobacter sp.]